MTDFGEPLRYRPYQARFVPDLAAPAEAHRRHMLDLQAKEQAAAVMAQRDREMAMTMEHQRATERNAEVHNNRRDGLYERQEERRNRELVLDRKHVTDAEHEQLIHQLFYGATEAEQRYAGAALARAGYQVPEPLYDNPAPDPAAAAPAAPPAAPAPKAPMSPKDKKLSSELDGIDKKYSAGLGAGGMDYKGALAKANGMGSLGVEQVGKDRWRPIDPADQGDPGAAPSKFLPGMTPVRARAVEADQMLSADDPYNKIVP